MYILLIKKLQVEKKAPYPLLFEDILNVNLVCLFGAHVKILKYLSKSRNVQFEPYNGIDVSNNQ